jgi:hypothetical protein
MRERQAHLLDLEARAEEAERMVAQERARIAKQLPPRLFPLLIPYVAALVVIAALCYLARTIYKVLS